MAQPGVVSVDGAGAGTALTGLRCPRTPPAGTRTRAQPRTGEEPWRRLRQRLAALRRGTSGQLSNRPPALSYSAQAAIKQVAISGKSRRPARRQRRCGARGNVRGGDQAQGVRQGMAPRPCGLHGGWRCPHLGAEGAIQRMAGHFLGTLIGLDHGFDGARARTDQLHSLRVDQRRRHRHPDGQDKPRQHQAGEPTKATEGLQGSHGGGL